MSDGFLAALIILAAIGCGVVGDVFFAFSAFVMRALAQGIAAMQAINAAAPALACIALAVTPWSYGRGPERSSCSPAARSISSARSC
jgi:hypothetical protein